MPGNLAQLLARRLADRDRPLLREWTADGWRSFGAGAVAAEAARWQAAFRREGFSAGDRVAVAARNGVAWVAIDQAALGLGLVVVPLYVDDNPESIAWCIAHSQARLAIVEGARLAAALATLPDARPLPTIVLRPGNEAPAGTPADAYLPAQAPPFEVVDVADDALATICYTSGTSGRPKGVMLSHGNILANVGQCQATGMARPDDRFLSVLPLSHMFERTGGLYLPLAIGAEVAFARGVAQLAEDLVSQRPTVMFAVPRILERVRSRIEQALSASPAKRALYRSCAQRGYRVASGAASLADRLLVPLLRRLAAAPIAARFGGRLRLLVVGGAPLDPELARTFIGLGLEVLHGYGMTEASPVIAVNREGDNVPETVGMPLEGIEVRVSDGGELLVRGRNVMRGYWRDPAATQAAIDADGFLHTGDLADIVDGRIRISGRAKDVLVLTSGEKLSPSTVEAAVLRDPAFEQAMVVGDGRAYPVLLAVSELGDDRELLRRANARLSDLPRWAKLRQVVRAPEPWSVANGLLTPTQKLKRPRIVERYRTEIDAAYRRGPKD
jgi:long-chain acyl-CoA synthetase